MNAASFYEEFKDAIRFLGLGWGQMGSIEMWIEGSCVVMAYGGREVKFPLPEKTK